MRGLLTGLGVVLALVALPAWAQSKPDRVSLPLQEALAGHWYLKKYDKHEYYQVLVSRPSAGETGKTYGPVKMTWDTKGGKEVSKGVISNSIHTVDDKQNALILTSKSADGAYTYFYRYAFGPDRNTLTQQKLDDKLKPDGDPDTLVFVDAKTVSPYVGAHPGAVSIHNKKAHDDYMYCVAACGAHGAVNDTSPAATMQCLANCKATCTRAGGVQADCG